MEQEIAGDTENGRVLLSQMDYNELGQLALKKLHSANDTSFVQDIDYLYDVRGWLKSINNMTDTTCRKLHAQDLEYFQFSFFILTPITITIKTPISLS